MARGDGFRNQRRQAGHACKRIKCRLVSWSSSCYSWLAVIPGMSRPRAATSVASSTPLSAEQNSKNVVVRFCCFCLPWMSCAVRQFGSTASRQYNLAAVQHRSNPALQQYSSAAATHHCMAWFIRARAIAPQRLLAPCTGSLLIGSQQGNRGLRSVRTLRDFKLQAQYQTP